MTRWERAVGKRMTTVDFLKIGRRIEHVAVVRQVQKLRQRCQREQIKHDPYCDGYQQAQEAGHDHDVDK